MALMKDQSKYTLALCLYEEDLTKTYLEKHQSFAMSFLRSICLVTAIKTRIFQLVQPGTSSKCLL